jgi:uncharacterized coiled-coil DUF342 family protein
MPGRVVLSEEDERAELDGRDRLRAIDTKLRDLYSRRTAALTQVRQLADEQKALADQRDPMAHAVDQAHRRQREIGHRLIDLRRERDGARRALDEAMADLREHRATGPKGDRPRPEQIKREMAELELRQQTSALKLTEENALIKHLRELQRTLEAAQKEVGSASAHAEKTKALEEKVKNIRTDLDQMVKEADALRHERDAQGGSVRDQLVAAGAMYAELRAKAKARGDAMARIETVSREIFLLESEGNKILRESRDRRHEAVQSVKDYNRGVRDATGGNRDLVARTADAQFEQLLKRGRITLGGGSGT